MEQLFTGQLVVWHHARGGGMGGYVEHKLGWVVGITETGVRIVTKLRGGGQVTKWVKLSSLTPRGENCRVCMGKMGR